MKLEATNQTVALIIADCLDHCNQLQLTQSAYMQTLHFMLKDRLNEPDLEQVAVNALVHTLTGNDVDSHWENNAQAGEESNVGESDQTEQPNQREPIYWCVECYKVWKGINPDKPVWASRNFVSTSWDDMNEIAEELELVSGNPHRVVKQRL